MFKLMKFPIMFLAFMALTFVSCDNEAIDPETDNYTLDEQDYEMMGRGKPDCFKLIFPITLELKNGETKEITDVEAMKEFLKRIKGLPGHMKGRRPHIQFPYQVELKNGNIITVENEEDQKELRNVCHIKRARKCFKPVLPVTLVYTDGSTLEITSKEEMKRALRDWYKNHAEGEARPHIQFPFDVKLKDDTVVTVENKDDIKRIIDGCRPDMEDKERCFRFNFPISMTFPDGAKVTLENPKALHDVFKIWKKKHGQTDRRPEFDFPISVTMTDNDEVVTVENKEELIALKESCE